jgi:hypothetical protein
MSEKSIRYYIKSLFQSFLKDVTELHLRENWQLRSDWVGGTRLPEHFKSMVTNFVTRVDPICKLSSPSSVVRFMSLSLNSI